MNRKEIILNTIDDVISDFLYYDRKEDVELPRGSIETALETGEITFKEIVSKFERALRIGLK